MDGAVAKEGVAEAPIFQGSVEALTFKKLVAGIYRRLGTLNNLTSELIGLLHNAAPAETTAGAVPGRQPALPGLSEEEWKPPKIEVRPREWSNTVKVWEVLWNFYHDGPFETNGALTCDAVISGVAAKTGGKIALATIPRVLSRLYKAGAAKREGRRTYRLVEPTDALREIVCALDRHPKVAALERKEA